MKHAREVIVQKFRRQAGCKSPDRICWCDICAALEGVYNEAIQDARKEIESLFNRTLYPRPLGMKKKRPPLAPKTKVKTFIDPERVNEGWPPHILSKRKSRKTGKILRHHDAHGLCYDVQHDDGSVGCYDPHELEILSNVME